MFTTSFKNLVMDNIFKGNSGASPLPSAYYVGLSATEMDASGGNITEPSGAGYARVPAPFSASSDGKVYNASNIEFPKSTGSWGTVSYCVLFDGPAEGASPIWCRPLDAPQTVTADNTLLFPPQELWLQFTELAAGE